MEHVPHPHIQARKNRSEKIQGFNQWLAVKISSAVGTMWCAYAFALLALTSFPAAIHGGIATTISWIAQTFIQLVLLSIIMVSQQIEGKAAEKRAIDTYRDAEAILDMCDEVLLRLKEIESKMK